eukprot:9055254-Alexandrium_andersonii.AAC.1
MRLEELPLVRPRIAAPVVADEAAAVGVGAATEGTKAAVAKGGEDVGGVAAGVNGDGCVAE